MHWTVTADVMAVTCSDTFHGAPPYSIDSIESINSIDSIDSIHSVHSIHSIDNIDGDHGDSDSGQHCTGLPHPNLLGVIGYT